MNMWVRRQISVLRACFFNMAHWVYQSISALRKRFSNASHWVRQQIPTLRERFHNASRIDQLLWITAALFILCLPIYLFVQMPPMGATLTGIFFGVLMVNFLWRDRYPALKRWIAETEHGQNNSKDPYGNEELPPPPPTGRRVLRILDTFNICHDA
jgi:hypothetical protein